MKGEFNMPKFDDYTQKSTPEDTDLMLLLDKTENANKKVLFSGIWNWIVKKLAEAVIEKLQTSDKTIIGALNELNSKSIRIGVYDLNNPPNDYFFIAKAGSTNLPPGYLGNAVMCIQLYLSENYGAMLCFGFGNDNIYIKRKQRDYGWSDWASVSLS